MYHFIFSNFLLLASCLLSHAGYTSLADENETKLNLPVASECDICLTPNCVKAAFNILTSLDDTVDPCDDFYSFACGGWIKKQKISDDQPEISVMKNIKIDIHRKLKDLLESKYISSEPPYVKMLKDFYSTCVKADIQGSEPLKKMLHRLGGWPVVEGSQWNESSFDWVKTLISFRKFGLDHNILFKFSVEHDPQRETVGMLRLEEPSIEYLHDANLTLGLNDPQIAAYFGMMLKAAKMLGAEKFRAKKELLEALRFEMALINIHHNADILNDILRDEKLETIQTIAELEKELSQVPWLNIINGLLLIYEVHENETFINGKPYFLVQFADLITSTDKRVIANYMLWRAILQSKKYLSEEWRVIEEENDRRCDKRKSMKEPRWKECLTTLGGFMQIGMGAYYVRNYFSIESKDEAIILVKYIHRAFLGMLEENDWMDETTKEIMKEKANALKTYVGYPDELLNDTFMMKMHENLTTTNDSYLDNVMNGFKWGVDKQFSILRKTQEEVKEMYNFVKYQYLSDVNAWYNPRINSISVPAGVLQGAIYNKDRPEYMNFGAVGFIIGHEITHGFDSTGRECDKDGNDANLWDKESDEHFRKKVQCIIDQYDNYTTDIGLKVNGEMTQDENIADNGGLKEAYLAYHAWTNDHGIEQLLPGVNYTQNQIFWISTAQVYCTKYQPEELKEVILYDSHSPEKFRINGPMSNLAEFSKDFNCPVDAPMNREYKCEVW